MRRRRKPRGAVEIRIGKRRYYAANRGDVNVLPSGHLVIWQEDHDIYIPIVGKRVEVWGPAEAAYGAEATVANVELQRGPRPVPDWMRRPTPEEEIAAVERAAAEFKARQRAELTASQRMVQGRPDSDD